MTLEKLVSWAMSRYEQRGSGGQTLDYSERPPLTFAEECVLLERMLKQIDPDGIFTQAAGGAINTAAYPPDSVDESAPWRADYRFACDGLALLLHVALDEDGDPIFLSLREAETNDDYALVIYPSAPGALESLLVYIGSLVQWRKT